MSATLDVRVIERYRCNLSKSSPITAMTIDKNIERFRDASLKISKRPTGLKKNPP